MNEAETRAEHIAPALAAAGWGVVEGSRIRREFPITPGRIEGVVTYCLDKADGSASFEAVRSVFQAVLKSGE